VPCHQLGIRGLIAGQGALHEDGIGLAHL